MATNALAAVHAKLKARKIVPKLVFLLELHGNVFLL